MFRPNHSKSSQVIAFWYDFENQFFSLRQMRMFILDDIFSVYIGIIQYISKKFCIYPNLNLNSRNLLSCDTICYSPIEISLWVSIISSSNPRVNSIPFSCTRRIDTGIVKTSLQAFWRSQNI